MAKTDEQIEAQDRRRTKTQDAKNLPPDRARGRGTADWANASPEDVLRLVCSVAMVGGAVRYGYTRDGGAYSIGIYQGDLSKTYYCNEGEGINERLQELAEFFEKR